MQVESPDDIVLAYTHQVGWLKHKLENLKQSGCEADPIYAKVTGALTNCQNALNRTREILAVPKGYWVLVLRSKVAGLEGKVGFVTYVNTDHNFATVSFDGGSHSHNLGMSKLLVINLPVPTMKIPAVGMKVKIKDDSTEYKALKWTSDKVYIENVGQTNPGIRLTWKRRDDIETIDGSSPV